ncbi:acetate/propionate family kinase [Noviherbaspirillum sp. UKPF54]|uniref:acetate/propionate family kinase n=1 Tax=Noviherbaspirillum sp. UKPF54 TaxID=2601898 RepID=UPI0011B114D3|nr:acetate/propionate family kinase [Noviherbaspirillum sp. UKPF54]QDZ27685.1 acetate/propionate family kinase [Noviherbaspirillum sp. UKPF54]
MSAAPNAILAVNAGSSSLKFALYPHYGVEIEAARLSGNIEGLEPGGAPTIKMTGPDGSFSEPIAVAGEAMFEQALVALEKVLERHTGGVNISAIAHRIVHGGDRLSESVLLDGDTLAYLATLSRLAPLHQPHNLAGVQAFRRIFPDLPQVGCFDTAFHATLPVNEQMFALPMKLREEGIRRYGFHGLSYRYVTNCLLERSPRAAGKTIVAHLGNGASACAIAGGKSVATTMGFSALDGLMMGTRSGALDPGVVLHLLRKGWNVQQLERTLYKESGLRGVSGVSADMRTLHASDEPQAALAIDLFIHRLIRECGSLTAALGGLDVIAFTGGIGEHDVEVRQRVCEALSYLGVRIDEQANRAATGDSIATIHTCASSAEIWVVPTDEGRVAAQDAARLIS